MADVSNGPNPAELGLTQQDLGVGFKETRPKDEIEARAFEIYSYYFGPNWQQLLGEYLFTSVRSATLADRERAGLRVGLVSTDAEHRVLDNRLIANHVVVFTPNSDIEYPLRTEVGEALWNILENATVTKTLPRNEEGKVAAGFDKLVKGNQNNQSAVVDFTGHVLDKWNSSYTEKPTNRYIGMNPDLPREYGGIPEWKSEGFADAIAVEIRRRTTRPLTTLPL